MPPDPQGTEAGPSTAGAVFRISDGSRVRISQRDLLRSRSLGLRELIDEEGVKREIPLQVDLSTDIDCTAVEWVVTQLQQQEPDVDHDPEGLARHCAVLWKYKCIPDPFESQENNINPQSSSGSISSADQQSSITSSATPSRAPRCWQGRIKHQTCRQLITIAIVLGSRKILEEEIKTAVWGTNKEMDIIVPLGVDIKAIRESELWKLFTCVYQKIAEIGDGNEKLAKSIRETLKQHNLGNFVQTWKSKQEELGLWTPYDFLLGLDKALSPPELQAQEPEPVAPVGVRELRPINWEGLFHKIRMLMSNSSLKQEKTAAILETLETHISKRRQELAAELMRQRDSTVQQWKDKLVEKSVP